MATPHIAARTAELVSKAMVNAGMSRQQLSKETLIPYNTLKRRLRGDEPTFNLSELFYVARALNVPPSSLLPESIADSKAA